MTPHGVFRHDDLAHLMGRTTMERFLKRHQGRIKGIISGFDRILFKGTFRSISYSSGLEKWLASRRVLQKDFAVFAQSLSSKIIEHAKKFSEKQGRPFRYVASSSASKEDMARQILEEDPVAEGLICVLSCVEPFSYEREACFSADRYPRPAAAIRKCTSYRCQCAAQRTRSAYCVNGDGKRPSDCITMFRTP